jgi:hypothetical protein
MQEKSIKPWSISEQYSYSVISGSWNTIDESRLVRHTTFGAIRVQTKLVIQQQTALLHGQGKVLTHWLRAPLFPAHTRMHARTRARARAHKSRGRHCLSPGLILQFMTETSWMGILYWQISSPIQNILKWFYFKVKWSDWSEVSYSEVLVNKDAMYIRVTLNCGYLIIRGAFKL